MGDDKKKKLANLTTFMLSQDYLPEHWNWSNSEKKSLSSFVQLLKQFLTDLFQMV